MSLDSKNKNIDNIGQEVNTLLSNIQYILDTLKKAIEKREERKSKDGAVNQTIFVDKSEIDKLSASTQVVKGLIEKVQVIGLGVSIESQTIKQATDQPVAKPVAPAA